MFNSFDHDYCNLLTFTEVKDLAKKINNFVGTKEIKLSGKGITRKCIESKINAILNSLDALVLDSDFDQNNIKLINTFSLFFSSKKLETIRNSKPVSRVYPTNKVEKYSPISANSPILKDQFNRIGFIDQNGYSYYGEVAILVLQALWDLPSEDDRSPSKELRQQGYTTQARVSIAAVTKPVEVVREGNLTIVNRSINISHKPTIYENGNKNCKVLTQGFNGSSIHAVDTKPLFQGGNNEVCLDHIIAVDWHYLPTSNKKRQDKQTTVLRKNTVKTKISWGSRYIPVVLEGQKALGHIIYLPTDTSLENSTKFNLVFELNGKINLYKANTNSLFITLGTYVVKYRPGLQGSNIDISIYEDIYKDFPHWVQPLDKSILDFLNSTSTSVQKRIDSTCLESNIYNVNFLFQLQDIGEKIRKSKGKAKYQKIKSRAKKAIFELYAKPYGESILGKTSLDTLQLVKTMLEYETKGLSFSSEENRANNNALIGYYKTHMETKGLAHIISKEKKQQSYRAKTYRKVFTATDYQDHYTQTFARK